MAYIIAGIAFVIGLPLVSIMLLALGFSGASSAEDLSEEGVDGDDEYPYERRGQ